MAELKMNAGYGRGSGLQHSVVSCWPVSHVVVGRLKCRWRQDISQSTGLHCWSIVDLHSIAPCDGSNEAATKLDHAMRMTRTSEFEAV